jgi:hypothetical protein
MPSDEEIDKLAQEFDASPDQLREAIGAVGPRPGAILMQLKGSRPSSNRDRVPAAGG